MVSLSFITPTIGRPHLDKVLEILLPQFGPGDESLIIGDGPQPEAKKIIEKHSSPYITYWEYGPIRNFGNPQRNQALDRAKGQFIVFVDDDDTPEPNCVAMIKNAVAQTPQKPHMFRMHFIQGTILPRGNVFQYGNVSGQMFVAPNIKGKVGRWSGRYGADFDFMMTTLAHHPPNSIVWRPEITCRIGFAGPRGAGGREIV